MDDQESTTLKRTIALPTFRYLSLMALIGAILGGCAFEWSPPDATLDSNIPESNASPFQFEGEAEEAIAALPFAENELIVQTIPGSDPVDVAAAIEAANARVIDEIPEIDLLILETGVDQLSATAESLADSGLFETLQKNYLYAPSLIPSDSLYSRQQHLPQIKADRAWDLTTGNDSIVIAIVDTGIDTDHPDLKGKIVGGRNIYDGNDRYDDVQGHGTMVAGVAAALSNNSSGVAGISWSSPLLAVRVGSAEGLSSSQHIAAGILWASANRAKVINVSFAPLWSDRIVQSAVRQAFLRGSLVVISAGNGGGTTSAASYDEVMFVGAITPQNQVATFSDKGPFVDLVAPGTAIRSTTFDGAYGVANGTSFAAPIVAGVAALAWSINPSLRPVTVRDAVLSTTTDLGTAGRDNTFGRGAVDAAAAVRKAQQSFDPVDTTPPTVHINTPATGQSLSGRASATISATDNVGVAEVLLSIDGIPFASDTRAPFSFVIDTTAFSPGAHDLAFVATDLAGNASAIRTVRVSFIAGTTSTTAGSVRFTSPAAGTAVGGDVTIRASVADADGLAVIEWFVDGKSVFVAPLSGKSSGVSYVWRSQTYSKGTHTITIAITDITGNTTRGSLSLVKQ